MKLIEVGRTAKPHGLKGEIKVVIDEAYEDDFFDASILFIRKQHQSLPYFLEEIRGGNALIVRLEGVKTREEAQYISHATILMKEEEVQNTTTLAEAGLFSYLTDFTVIDKDLGELGIIKEVVEMPYQELALIDYKGKEVMIPLHENLFESVDEAGKKLYVELPDGLLEL